MIDTKSVYVTLGHTQGTQPALPHVARMLHIWCLYYSRVPYQWFTNANFVGEFSGATSNVHGPLSLQSS